MIAAGLEIAHDDPALWTIDHPERIVAIHARDHEAGAEVLTTCTFGANRQALARSGRSSELERINQAAVTLARGVIGPNGYVLGNLGPRVAEQAGAALEQALILAAAGVDALILETFTAGPILEVLDELARSDEPLPPLIASLWLWPEPAEELARRLVDSGAALVGMNCRHGAAEALAFARSMADTGGISLSIRPSADPDDSDSTPDAFARAVPELVDLGCRMLGGCCGTTELHVARIRQALNHSLTSTRPLATSNP